MSAVQVMYLPRCAIKIFAHAHSSGLSGFHINRTQRTQVKCQQNLYKRYPRAIDSNIGQCSTSNLIGPLYGYYAHARSPLYAFKARFTTAYKMHRGRNYNSSACH